MWISAPNEAHRVFILDFILDFELYIVGIGTSRMATSRR